MKQVSEQNEYAGSVAITNCSYDATLIDSWQPCMIPHPIRKETLLSVRPITIGLI
jgi:hypothetical protein